MRFIFVLFFYSISYGQTVRHPVAALYPGLGAYSDHFTDALSFVSNQASLARIKKFSAAVYGERRFMMAELNLYQMAVVFPTAQGNFGLKTGYYGFSDYNEFEFGFAYARKLGVHADLGVQFNYGGVNISGYGNSGYAGFEIGTVLHLTEKLHAGMHWYYPGLKRDKNETGNAASVFSFGTGYEPSENFFVCTVIEKEEDQPVNIIAGMQYKFLPRVLASTGISTNTSNLYFGIGLLLKSFRLDLVTGYHPQLGLTPGLLLLFGLPHHQN